VFEGHVKALQARRNADLIREKVLLIIDGSGHNAWADILHGTRVAIPPSVVEFQLSENLLRSIVTNAVAQHVTQLFHFHCDSKADRESRERARVDRAWANHLSQEQDFNGVFGQALHMAMATGFCPVHRYWRDDLNFDPYEPLYHKQDEMQAGWAMPQRGMVDVWVGNPFDTTFNSGAKYGSVQAMRYGRVLPADQVRAAFEGNPFTDMKSFEGSTKLPSAAIYQRIVSRWTDLGLSAHGSPAWSGGRENEELISIVCEERAPGTDPDYPNGRLIVIGVPGAADTYQGRGEGKHVALLADQDLPAGGFSWENVYSHDQFDSITGAAAAEPWADSQQRYNLYISIERELMERARRAPTVINGHVNDDDLEFDGWTVIQAEGGTGVNARTLEVSGNALSAIQNMIERTRNDLFTIGGYQAASRGESQPGAAAAKVLFESRQDDSVHGPRDVVFRRTVCDFMQGCWKLMKAYGDVPWLLNVVGEEFEHLVNPEVGSQDLSEDPPQYRLTQAFGSTLEGRANEVITLSQTIVEDRPLLGWDETRAAYPGDVFGDSSDPRSVQKRRAKTVVAEIRRAADQAQAQLEQAQQQLAAVPPMWQGQAQQALALQSQQVVPMVIQDIETRFPMKRSDDLMAFIGSLTELVQDETENPIARAVGEWKLDRYFEWQMMMAQGMGAPLQIPRPGDEQKPTQQLNDPRTEGGLDSEVSDLTQQAQQGAA
jgi:hypothetical protein